MPESTDFADIPNQDPTNKVTAAKVELGKMLFFETGIGINSLNPDLRETYSCSTCHIPEKSFTPGRFQGIADGGMGFGHLGEGRLKTLLMKDLRLMHKEQDHYPRSIWHM